MRIKVTYKYGVSDGVTEALFTPYVSIQVEAEFENGDLEEMKRPFLIKKTSKGTLDGIGVCSLYDLQTRPILEPSSEGYFRSNTLEVKISLSRMQAQDDVEIDQIKNQFVSNIIKGLKVLKSQILQPSVVEYYEVV